MSVLLLRLAGPMQSWGTQSRFSHRDTGLEPSKSGVIGIVGAALGTPRNDEAGLKQLADLTMTVRVDRQGSMMRDYHTAMDVRKADGKSPPKSQAVLSERYYLADAEFLVGLEGDESLLRGIDAALRAPIWPIFLGRKSFLPSKPIFVGLREGSLLDVLKQEPMVAETDSPDWFDPDEAGDEGQLRVVMDVPYGEGEPRQDVPISFDPPRYRVRHVRTEFIPRPQPIEALKEASP